MAKTESKSVAVKDDGALPDYLRNVGKTTRIGNIDQSDVIIPRVKLMQAISPEVETFEAARVGQFWHTIMETNLGPELAAVPILLRKTYVLWAPRNDDRNILARASDGVKWDVPDLEFTVRPKNFPTDVTYKLGRTVAESGLDKFGSSRPGDPQSPPAASLTYEILWLFPDFLELGPAIILNTRSQVKPAQQLISKVEGKPVDHFYQRYIISSIKQTSDDGDFYNYRYTSDGYADEAIGEQAKALYEKFKDQNFRANEETDETGGEGGGSSRAHSTAADSDKY